MLFEDAVERHLAALACLVSVMLCRSNMAGTSILSRFQETNMLMSSADFRESLRQYKPTVFIDGERIASVADEPRLAPGVNALGLTYDYALRADLAPLMTATQASTGSVVNRMLHINQSSGDLLNKLEAVRILCQETGCAQRYLCHDGFNALWQATHRMDADLGTEYHQRFQAYLKHAEDLDITVGIAMTDAKGDRSKRPHKQGNPDTYVHIVERTGKGIVISGTKAIVTGAPYMHEFLVMPCRSMVEADADFAVCCAVPVDAAGITIVARPAGRPGEKAALFSGKYGQSTGVVMFDKVFVPWEKVFLAGEWEHSGFLTTNYATHHRHSCIAARAGFGDLLIGAGALMCEANGFNPETEPHLREEMVNLIKIVEGFYACGVAASVYGTRDPAGNWIPGDRLFQHRQAAAGDADLRHAPHRPHGQRRPDRRLARAGRRPQPRHRRQHGRCAARLNPAVPYDKRIEVGALSRRPDGEFHRQAGTR